MSSIENQDRDAFEKVVTEKGWHSYLAKVGPGGYQSGEYAHTIMQTCWEVWQRALTYARNQQSAEEQHTI